MIAFVSENTLYDIMLIMFSLRTATYAKIFYVDVFKRIKTECRHQSQIIYY